MPKSKFIGWHFKIGVYFSIIESHRIESLSTNCLQKQIFDYSSKQEKE